MSGKLYVCATPIGNLSDMTQRCIDTLKTVDLIAAEDTRKTIKLLNHFGIDTPMTSYYEHNKRQKGDYILRHILSGKDVAIVSDAGTPAISDPGEDIVVDCIANDVEVIIIPGACAAIAALAISGLPTGRFCFEGFLSVQRNARKQHLDKLKTEERTIIMYEAPHKLKNTLKDLYGALGNRKLVLARELTKIHEEAFRATLSEAMAYYEVTAPRGEYVLLLEGKEPELEKNDWEDLTIEDHVAQVMASGESELEAIKTVAKLRGLRKNEVYAQVKIK